MPMTGKELIQQLGYLEIERTPYEEAWEDCRIYALPESLPIYGDSIDPGQKDLLNYDSTAELASRNLASNLMASTTNPSTKWIQLECDDEEVNKTDEEAKQYFEEVETIITNAIDNSNCYARLIEFYKSLVVFGTGVTYIEKGKLGEDLNFTTLHIAELYLAENHQGYVDTVFRKIKMTLRQVVQKFGYDALNDARKKQYKVNPHDDIEIVHAVYPRDDAELANTGNFKTTTDNMPWASIWIDGDKNEVLKESGYRTFPFAVARWSKESGQVYGHGPVMETLPDIRVLNAMEKARLHLAEKIANPPVGVLGTEEEEISFEPGTATPLDQDTKIIWLVPGANFPITDNAFRTKKQSVIDALYGSQLYNINMLSEKTMTAEEVRARQMENLKILGPAYSNIQAEFLENFITRVIDILYNDGRLPKAPASLADKEFRFRFINPLSAAQKRDETQMVEYVISRAMNLAQINPAVLDVIDFDKALKIILENSGAPHSIINSDKAIRDIREARAQQQAQQQQIQQAVLQTELQEKQAKTEEKMSRAEKNRRLQ